MRILKSIKRILYVVVGVLVMIVIFRNMESTRVELIFTTIDMPLAALLVLTLVIGFVFGFTANTIWRLRRRRSSD